MSMGRIVAAGAASLAVAGCAAVALGMSRASDDATADPPVSTPAATSPSATRPAFLPMSAPPAPPTTRVAPSSSVASTSAAARSTTTAAVVAPAPSPRAVVAGTHAAATTTSAAPKPTPYQTARRTSAAPAPHGQALPLRYGTGSATRVITVTAHSAGSRTATLQAWTKAAGGGWTKYGAAVTAHVGADGLSSHPSEYRSATPMGSFTLTQAFGRNADPGTSLRYFRTRTSDWWISQAGPLYNTHQRCSSGCAFTRGDPNEHLYYETPYYNYAVVIDYNTRNAPGGVRQGAGSAFFLHVTDGNPTAGCVAIPQSKLVSLLRWLAPSAHPRILIGVG